MLGRLSASFRHAHNECVVSVGRPADSIASLAAEYGVGLVVMGLANAEDSELRRPGSIAYRVLRISHLPIVVVPAQQSSALSQVSASLGHSGCTLGNIESDQREKGHRS
jgi:hypothetical protein